MTLQSGLLLDTTGDLWLLWGMGSPLGDTLSDRGKGSLYLQLDAVPNNFLWAKTNGDGNPTAWALSTTSAQATVGFPAFGAPGDSSGSSSSSAFAPPGPPGARGPAGLAVIGPPGMDGPPGRDGYHIGLSDPRGDVPAAQVTSGTFGSASGDTNPYKFPAAVVTGEQYVPITLTGIETPNAMVLYGSGATNFAGLRMVNAAAGANILLTRYDGTPAAPTALVSADVIGRLRFGGYDGTNTTLQFGVDVFATATQNWSSSAHGTKLTFQTTPNGSTTETTALTLDQDQSATFAGAVTGGAASFTSLTNTLAATLDTGAHGSSFGGAVSMGALTATTGTFSGAVSGITTLTNTGAATLDTGATGSSFGGVLNVVGNFSVATSKFTVASASGNTAVAGTLNVTGAATLDTGATGSTFGGSLGVAALLTASLGINVRNGNVNISDALDITWGASTTYIQGSSAGNILTFNTNSATVLILGSASVTLASGVTLKLGNAYVSSVLTGTGYVTALDSTGTTYKLLCHT